MFTGIVRAICNVVECSLADDGIMRLAVELPQDSDPVQLGASIAVNGCCLTVSSKDEAVVRFEVVVETLALTNLSGICPHSKVNLERSYRVGDEIGGHILAGHIATTAAIQCLEKIGNQARLVVKVPTPWTRYLMPKGFIALNGASLTIAELDRERQLATINLIPETLQRTTFGTSQVGDHVNLEVDSQTQAIVDTVQAMLQDKDWIDQIEE